MAVDEDELRDRIVYRSAHGLCCVCGGPGPRICSTGEYIKRPLGAPVDTNAPGGRQFNYGWCGSPGCAEGFMALEMMGRLPHQSGTAPRGRWVDTPRGWELESAGLVAARIEPYAEGCCVRAVELRGAPIYAPTPEKAMSLAELIVVRAVLRARVD